MATVYPEYVRKPVALEDDSEAIFSPPRRVNPVLLATSFPYTFFTAWWDGPKAKNVKAAEPEAEEGPPPYRPLWSRTWRAEDPTGPNPFYYEVGLRWRARQPDAETVEEPSPTRPRWLPGMSNADPIGIDVLSWVKARESRESEAEEPSSRSRWFAGLTVAESADSLVWLRVRPCTDDAPDEAMQRRRLWHPRLSPAEVQEPDSHPWLRRQLPGVDDGTGTDGAVEARRWSPNLLAPVDPLVWVRVRRLEDGSAADVLPGTARRSAWQPWLTPLPDLPLWMRRRGTLAWQEDEPEAIRRILHRWYTETVPAADALVWLRRHPDVRVYEEDDGTLTVWRGRSLISIVSPTTVTITGPWFVAAAMVGPVSMKAGAIK